MRKKTPGLRFFGIPAFLFVFLSSKFLNSLYY